jgi:DNA polymerase-3 subunit delta
MVAVSHNDAERFIGAPNDACFIFLIFGADRGLVSERSLQITRGARASDQAPIQIAEFSGDVIAADPLILVDEANSIDLFEPATRIIRVAVAGKSPLPALELVSRAPPSKCLIILESGDLRRDAPLRKWVEAQSFAAAIECRQDDARSVLRLLEQELAAVKQSIEPSARDALLDALGEDRIATRNEIEKLLLFTYGQSHISLSDVGAVSHDPNVTKTDEIIDGSYSHGRMEILELVHRSFMTGLEPTAILIMMLRHANALHRSLAEIESGRSQSDALQSLLRQTGGFSRKTAFGEQLRSLRTDEMIRLIARLNTFMVQSRRNPILYRERLIRLLMSSGLSRCPMFI